MLTPAPRSDVFAGPDAIEGEAQHWEDAARAAGASLPYCGPGYARALIASYHAADDPVLLRASVGDQNAYLLTIKRPLKRYGYPVRERGFPFNPNTILNDPLLPDPVVAPALAQALLERVFADDTQSLILDHLPKEGTAVQSLIAAAAQARCGADAPRAARTLYHATLPGDWDAYLATRSRNHRWQIRKALKKAAEDPEITIERLQGRDAIAAALPDWFSVETRSWQGADAASAMDDADRMFHAKLLETLAEDAVGDLWMVRFGGVPVAALRMLAAPGQVSVHTMHFDAAERSRGPGLLAFIAMMQAACDAGLDEVDMHGSTEFFARWATGTREHQSVRLYRPGLSGQALKAARAWTDKRR